MSSQKMEKNKTVFDRRRNPTAVFILSAIIIISTDPYAGNSWDSEYRRIFTS